MISERMKTLIRKLDDSSYEAGYQCRRAGAVSCAAVINARVDLISAIQELEAQVRGRRETIIRETIENDEAASFTEPRTTERL